MAEPPTSWDQQDEDTSSLASATSKLGLGLGRLNVNAHEFVPSFGAGVSAAPKPSPMPAPAVPKTPPSTPVVPVERAVDVEKKASEPSMSHPPKTTSESHDEPSAKNVSNNMDEREDILLADDDTDSESIDVCQS